MTIMDGFLRLAREEFDAFKAELERVWGWPTSFSTNHHRDIWAPPGYGYTPDEDRDQLRGRFAILDEVADRYLQQRSDGGRFFINDNLAFYKPERDDDPRIPIVIFDVK